MMGKTGKPFYVFEIEPHPNSSDYDCVILPANDERDLQQAEDAWMKLAGDVFDEIGDETKTIMLTRREATHHDLQLLAEWEEGNP